MHQLSTSYQHELALSSVFRSGDYLSIPGLSKKHVSPVSMQEMEVVNESLQSVYPLSHRLLEAEEWDSLIQQFVWSHGSFSPKVWYMPKEFYLFVLRSGEEYLEKYDCLKDLLLMEWLELELCMADYFYTYYTAEGNLLTDKLVLNPIHRLQRFSYPVHSRNAKFITEDDKSEYCLILHRMPESGEIIYTRLLPLQVHVVAQLMQRPQPLNVLVSHLNADKNLSTSITDGLDLVPFFKTAVETQLIIGFC